MGELLVAPPARLAFAGQHTSLLVAPDCVARAAHAMLHAPFRPPEQTAMRKPFERLPKSSHLQLPHCGCLSAMMIFLSSLPMSPLYIDGFSAGSHTGAVMAILAARCWMPAPQYRPCDSAESQHALHIECVSAR